MSALNLGDIWQDDVGVEWRVIGQYTLLPYDIFPGEYGTSDYQMYATYENLISWGWKTIKEGESK